VTGAPAPGKSDSTCKYARKPGCLALGNRQYYPQPLTGIVNMNRHERRVSAKQVKLEGTPAATPSSGPVQRPGLALRIFARILLSQWVLNRVHHPDIVRILMQMAQQVGRTDAIAQLAVKSYSN